MLLRLRLRLPPSEVCLCQLPVKRATSDERPATRGDSLVFNSTSNQHKPRCSAVLWFVVAVRAKCLIGLATTSHQPPEANCSGVLPCKPATGRWLFLGDSETGALAPSPLGAGRPNAPHMPSPCWSCRVNCAASIGEAAGWSLGLLQGARGLCVCMVMSMKTSITARLAERRGFAPALLARMASTSSSVWSSIVPGKKSTSSSSSGGKGGSRGLRKSGRGRGCSGRSGARHQQPHGVGVLLRACGGSTGNSPPSSYL